MDKLFVLRVLASATYDLAYSGAWGILLAAKWLAYKSPWEVKLYRILRVFVVLLACILFAQAWLLTATMSGESDFTAVCGMIRQTIFETSPGRILGMQFLVAVVIALGLFFKRSLTGSAVWLQLGLFAFLAALRSASGHAASYGNFTVQELVQWVHLGATAAWSGSVFISGLVVSTDSERVLNSFSIRAYGIKLSQTATLAVACVGLTGIYNAYLGLGKSIVPLTHTQWGYTLIAKSTLVMSALALGSRNRYLLSRSEADWDAATESGFVRSLRIESVVMILILIVSAWLANSPPANEM